MAHLDRDHEYLLDLPEFVEVTELHVNDWQPAARGGIDMTQAHAHADALHAPAPNVALAAKLQLYGQFVGSWDLDIDFHPPGAATIRAEAEWHFDWVLDGKAIQDVWIFPARRLRRRTTEPWHMYGSTFRWYDPAIDAWHITYFDPGRPLEMRQIGRAVGADIVQVGEDQNGILSRWRFVEITRTVVPLARRSVVGQGGDLDAGDGDARPQGCDGVVNARGRGQWPTVLEKTLITRTPAMISAMPTIAGASRAWR